MSQSMSCRTKKILILAPIIALLGLILTMLTSCLGVEMEVAFNPDGSGTMTLVFKVSQELLEMGEEQAGVNIPLNSSDLEEEYGAIEGVTVEEIFQEETESNRIITAKLKFDDFNALSGDDEFPAEGASLSTKDQQTIFKMLVGQPDASSQENAEDQPDMEMDEAMTAMMQSFLEGYFLEYRIVAPRKIIRHSHGELSKDKKTLLFAVPMGEFIMIEEPYYLEVVW